MNTPANIDLNRPLTPEEASPATHFDGGLWQCYQAAFWQTCKQAAGVERKEVVANMHHDNGGPNPIYQVRFWEDYKAMARVLPRDVSTGTVGPNPHPRIGVLPVYQADFWSAVRDGRGPELLDKVLKWRAAREVICSKAGMD